MSDSVREAFEVVDRELRRDIPQGGSQVVRAWDTIKAALSANGGVARHNYDQTGKCRGCGYDRPGCACPTPPSVAVPEATAAEGLISIVEGIQGIEHGTWRDDNGVRLKDTKQWMQFYLSVRNGGTQQSFDHEKLASALREIEGTVNRTATSDQFIRHLKKIATDALAAAPSPDHIADAGKVATIPLDPRYQEPRPLITNAMKADHIGEYQFTVDTTDAFGNEVTEQFTVPWDTCKAIYKGMAKTAMRSCPATPSVPENEVKVRALSDADQLRKEAWQIINGAKTLYTRDYLRRVIEVLYRLRTAGEGEKS